MATFFFLNFKPCYRSSYNINLSDYLNNYYNNDEDCYNDRLTCVMVASYIFAASLLFVVNGNPSFFQA